MGMRQGQTGPGGHTGVWPGHTGGAAAHRLAAVQGWAPEANGAPWAGCWEFGVPWTECLCPPSPMCGSSDPQCEGQGLWESLGLDEAVWLGGAAVVGSVPS